MAISVIQPRARRAQVLAAVKLQHDTGGLVLAAAVDELLRQRQRHDDVVVVQFLDRPAGRRRRRPVLTTFGAPLAVAANRSSCGMVAFVTSPLPSALRASAVRP